MATKYLNDTGLKYFYERLKILFAGKTEFNDLKDKVDQTAANIPTKTSDLTNNGDGTSNYATESYVDTNGGKIDKIFVNGNEQTISNKTINLSVPTKLSDLTNDGNYVVDENYVHTDTNYIAADKAKVDKLVFNGDKIDNSLLPSYVDDVIEAYPVGATELASDWLSLTTSGAPLVPESGKIYVLMADTTNYTTNSQFRFGGTTYVKLSDGGVSSITTAEIDTIITGE